MQTWVIFTIRIHQTLISQRESYASKILAIEIPMVKAQHDQPCVGLDPTGYP